MAFHDVRFRDGDAAEMGRMGALLRKLKDSNFPIDFTELLYRAAREGQVQEVKVSPMSTRGSLE